MGLTLAQMRDQLELAVVNAFPANANQLTPANLTGWLNSGFQELDRDLRWTRCTHTFSTVANQSEYVIPVEVREVLIVEFTDADDALHKLRPIGPEDWIDRRVDSDLAGTPEFYWHHGDKYNLYPKPDATLADAVKFWIVSEPPDLALDADTPGFPSHLHQRVIDYALVYVYRHFGQFIYAQQLRAGLHAEIMEERHEPAIRRGGALKARTSGW